MPVMMGQIIKKMRLKKSMSQTDLAMNSNYSKSYICDLEKGRKKPSEETCCVIFSAMGFDYNAYTEKNHKINKTINNIVEYIVQGDIENYTKSIRGLENDRESIELSFYYRDFDLFEFIYKLLRKEEIGESYKRITEYLENDYFEAERKQLCSLYLGVFQRNQGNYEQAKIYYNHSLVMQNEERITALTYYHLAIINEYEKDYFKAYENNRKAQTLFMKHLYLKRAVFIETHIGILYAKLHAYDRADETFNTVIKEAKEYGIKDTLQIGANNIIWNAVLCKKYEKAYQYYTSYKAVFNHDAHGYLMIAWICYKINKNKEALNFIQKGKAVSANSPIKNLALTVLEKSILNEASEQRNIRSIIAKNSKMDDGYNLLLFILEDYFEKNGMYKKALIVEEEILMLD